jgi:hypothetical protein
MSRPRQMSTRSSSQTFSGYSSPLRMDRSSWIKEKALCDQSWWLSATSSFGTIRFTSPKIEPTQYCSHSTAECSLWKLLEIRIDWKRTANSPGIGQRRLNWIRWLTLVIFFCGQPSSTKKVRNPPLSWVSCRNGFILIRQMTSAWLMQCGTLLF